MLITKIYQLNEIAQAANELRLGELIAFPTETVYGLGADATNEKAVKRVYQAKGRPSDNPLIVNVCDRQMVIEYTGELSKQASALMDAFWPGPLTLILKIKPNALPSVVTGGLKTAAFRMPQNQATLELIRQAQVPLVGPSANSSGKPSPTTAQHVFHDLEGKIAGILDDGPTQVGVESTILDLSTETPTVLRPGAISPKQIEAILKTEVLYDNRQVKQQEVPKAPGMKYKHYAPDAQVIIVNETSWPAALAWAKQQVEAVGIMATTDILNELETTKLTYCLGDDVVSASQKLFDGLRYFDEQPAVKYILVQGFAEEDLGAAYMNRLKKAAGNTFFDK